MKNLEKYKTILWDFDGVILDSMKVRSDGFRWVLKDYPENQVSDLVRFHESNGGLSRYVKFRYFFNQIRCEEIDEYEVIEFSETFSSYMRDRLTDKDLLIKDSMQFLISQVGKKDMHIVSGSDQSELRFLCERLDIVHFFKSIQGSPTPKTTLVKNLVLNYSLDSDATLLIGDSQNDLDAAIENNISFLGYNNQDLKGRGPYIDSFSIFLNETS